MNISATADGGGINILNVNGLTLSNFILNSIHSSANFICYLDLSTNIIIDSSSFYNCSFSVNMVAISGCSIVKFVSSVITNNYGSLDNTQFMVFAGPYTSNLFVSNNLFGGTNNSTTSIGARIGVTNYIFVNNTFIFNWLGYIMRIGTKSTNDINAVNDTAYTLATVSSGNKLTNF